MAWEPIKTAPMNRRVLVCDEKGKVFVARASTLRWRDEADRLIDRPKWWQSLPSPPSEERGFEARSYGWLEKAVDAAVKSVPKHRTTAQPMAQNRKAGSKPKKARPIK